MERPKVSHLETVKRILRYVQGSIGWEILFLAPNTGGKCTLLVFTDSNWCKDKDDRKSTAGYIFIFSKTPISWCSKKELIIALSSCEVGYIIASLFMCQVVWLMNLLKDMGSNVGDVVTLLVDNVFELNLAKSPIAYGMGKHIEMKFYYLRELVSEGRLILGYSISEDQVTDLLIK
ncbi:secreted RxLR effector protein 161-like [Lathyrus oleraceus]|uniref:secreted RxLR effector protein 161-like n=1 Tax=Pisum sativum TaxID=3888 RepID=UPI0021D02FF5|nr:secreted RxLR effector protein 161-like [Pisum sativum]